MIKLKLNQDFTKAWYFFNKDEFKKALLYYEIKFKKDLGFIKNEINRVRVVCKVEGCLRKILGSLIGDRGYVVKTY